MLAAFDHLPALRGLNLSGTAVSASAGKLWQRWPNLEFLYLAKTPVGDAVLEPPPVGSRLRFIDLEGTSISDAGLAGWEGRLESPNSFSAADTAVTDVGLARLAKAADLEYLQLGGCRITDAGLAAVAQLPKLQTLTFPRTEVTDAGLAHLSGLWNLQSLDLEQTKVGDAALEHLAPLTRLTKLSLAGTQITDAALAQVAQHARLISLNLRGTAVSDAGLAALQPLVRLASLDLSDTAVGDAGLAHLAALPRPRELKLNRTRVTADGLAQLRKIPSLRLCEFDGTSVTPADRESLLRDLLVMTPPTTAPEPLVDPSRCARPSRSNTWIAASLGTIEFSPTTVDGKDWLPGASPFDAITTRAIRTRIEYENPYHKQRDAEIGIQVRYLDPTGAVFNRRQHLAVTGSEDHDAALWNVDTGELIGSRCRHPARVKAVAISRDGRRVLTGCEDGFARLWAIPGWMPSDVSVEQRSAILSVDFSPDGELFMTASADGRARVWHSTTGFSVGPALVHGDRVNVIRCHPSGTSLLTAADDGIVRIWELAVPSTAEVAKLMKLIELLTGLRQETNGAVRPLTIQEWIATQ